MGWVYMKKWNSATLAAAMAIVLLTAGCGGGKESGAKTEGTATPGSNKPAEPAKPVKLLVITPQGGNMEWFMTRYGSQIQKKYPNYEFEVVESVGNNVQNLVIEQRKVDLIISSVNNYRASLLDLYGGDISDLIAKQKYDLSRLEPSYIEAAKVNGKNQNGLPLYDLRLALYYNKDIFDKFGVPYLKNHMTWEEVAEVATKLTRNDGGVQYRGFVASPNPLLVVNPLSIPYTDEKGEKAKALGADYVVNYRTERFEGEVRRLTKRKGVDVVFEHVGADTWNGSLLCLKRGGRLVTCGSTSGVSTTMNLMQLFQQQYRIFGSFGCNIRNIGESLEKMAGGMSPVIDSVFALDDFQKGLERLESRKAFGKIVVTF